MSGILRWLFSRIGKKRLSLLDGEFYLDSPYLSNNVEIMRDKWGIPHIYAENKNDLFFAQGFVHAQDRLWQMELYRRTASGTLSEIFGADALETDKMLRVFGFKRNGIKSYEVMAGELKNLLKAYVAGVNYWLNHPNFKLPLEFSLIKHKPSEWTIDDSMGFVKLMQFQLSGQFGYKILFTQLEALVGEDAIKDLFPDYGNETPRILPTGLEFNFRDENGVLKSIEGPFLNKKGASNGWTISGDLTETGRPIQCNDPHLSPSLPSIWYMVHLNCPDFQVYGVGPPVVPFILIGHNNSISWGFTVANADAEDVFLEILNENESKYYFKEEWRLLTLIDESIKINGEENPFNLVVKETHHGPIISEVVGLRELISTKNIDNIPYNPKNFSIALRSTALDVSSILEGMYRLNMARDWNDFVNAVKLIDCPQQNLTYADKEGNIGSYVCGKIPIRKNGNGARLVIGWSGEYEWEDWVPFEKMPHSYNPNRGYIITANNCPIPSGDYPYYLGQIWDPGFRARIIEEFIQNKTKDENKISIQDLKELHMDFKSLCGIEFIDSLNTALKSNNINKEELIANSAKREFVWDILNNWDGVANKDSIGAAIYEVFWQSLLDLLIEPVLSANIDSLENQIISNETLKQGFSGEGFNPLVKGTHELYHSLAIILENLFDNKDSIWIQKAGGLKQWIKSALLNTFNYLERKLGKNQEKWKWGALNKIVYPHAMSIKPPLDKVFNIGPFPIGGDRHTVNQQGSFIHDFSQKHWSPSYRQIVDVGQWDRSLVIFSPGQSGQLGSLHYSDLFEYWYKGEYILMAWSKEAVIKIVEHKIILKKS